MIKGKTASGFAFVVDDDARDDYDLLNAFMKLQEGHNEYLDQAVEILLGKEQKEKLREHCRSKSGRVLASKIVEEVGEIINIIGKANDEVKN